MKNIILLLLYLLLSLYSCNTTKCYDFTESNKEYDEHIASIPSNIYAERINMWGVSSISQYEMAIHSVKFTCFDTKAPVVKYSRKAYQNFELSLDMHSNNDTGADKFQLFEGNVSILTEYFTDNKKKYYFHLHEHTKLKFIVSCDGNPNFTAGAFDVFIKIKELN